MNQASFKSTFLPFVKTNEMLLFAETSRDLLPDPMFEHVESRGEQLGSQVAAPIRL